MLLNTLFPQLHPRSPNQSDSTTPYFNNDNNKKRKVSSAVSLKFAAPTPSTISSFTCSAFFCHVLPVPPSRFRPPTKFGDFTFDHAQNYFYKAILENGLIISQSNLSLVNQPPGSSSSAAKKLKLAAGSSSNGSPAEMSSALKQKLDTDKVVRAWMEIQRHVTLLFDSSSAPPGGGVPAAGIRQMLEKKQGLFRMNMMGKRVNYSCRSVLSPDPYINTNEIGIPVHFARKLTYPQPVNAHNHHQMRMAVINGAHQHPGANFVQEADGTLINLSPLDREARIALSKSLLTNESYGAVGEKGVGDKDFTNVSKKTGVKSVLRHLQTGDIVLVNRQPTLHKPSIMAHKVVVSNVKEQPIRMHYANCNTYNADFDGDEINVHFPQDELARAEGYNIALTDEQYIGPCNGAPLRGLIQDHVVSGVLLTKRDTFFTRQEFQQLVYSCGSTYMTINQRMETPIPCILKPVPLWSGKQVLSSLLDILTFNLPPFNFSGKARTPETLWGVGKQGYVKSPCEEGLVVIRRNQLLSGVLDKNAFGASTYSLVHACYELYGAKLAGNMLSAFGRLFTIHLQSHGFTCGIDDLLLTDEANAARSKHIDVTNNVGTKAACDFAGVEKSDDVWKAMQEKKSTNPDILAKLDQTMSQALNVGTSEIIDLCLPLGQKKRFPHNNMSMMTQSGAKGSNVNVSQISCLLGQQTLEGRRVPSMVSGKTLPSFKPYDTAPRAGGWISQRFLTGIKPQEYYFHCMAGREGLVDTAVKTSRSGYLQRCLVKHLECLTVAYDCTVRDVDGSVVQFHYGEDSLDVLKQSYMTQMGFLAENYEALVIASFLLLVFFCTLFYHFLFL